MNRKTITLLSLLSLTALAEGTEPKPENAPPKEGASTATKKGEGKKKEKPAEEKKDDAAPAPKPADAH